MHDPLVVRRRQPARDLLRELGRLPRRQCSGIQPPAQRLALQKLRDEIRRAVMLAKIMNRQNVGMIQRRDRLRLLLKAPQPFRIAGKRRRQNFDRNLAIQPRVSRAIHLTHAAGAGGRHDLVGPEFRACGECSFLQLRRPIGHQR